MKGFFVLLSLLLDQGASFDDSVSVSVMEGDSVTLNTGVQSNQDDTVRWYFNDILIARISGDLSKTCTDVQCNEGNERFRGRLKLDHQTGSLTIMNITNTHSGEYTLISHGRSDIYKIFIVSVHGEFGAETVEVKQVLEGGSVTLNTGVTKQQRDKMLWYFNDTRIALINVESSTSCLYDGENRRFRDRLEVDYETGSLTITNITTEHAGRYEAEIIRSKSSGTSTSLNRNRKCDSTKITRKISSAHDDTIKIFSVSVTVADKTNKADKTAPNEHETDMSIYMNSGLSSAVVKGIVAAVVVGVIYYRHRSSRKDFQQAVLNSWKIS